MFGSETLEVAIGIIFVFILVSIICSTVREGIEAWLKTRAAHLENGIRELLHDQNGEGLAKSFYNHPLIYSLFSGDYKKRDSKNPMIATGGDLPSYIPASNFATALIDIAARGPETATASSDSGTPVISLDSIRANVSNLQNPWVQRVLLTAVDSAQGDLNKAQANLEAWYNSAMDRVSGRYKRSTQKFLFLIALLVAVGMNIDTLRIADYLHSNEAARATLVARAEAAKDDPDFPKQDYKTTIAKLNDLNLPIGWSNYQFGEIESPWQDVVSPLLGWLLTALAATLGAPFWFDVLNKVMVIRSTVKPHEKSQEEGSEDRQDRTPPRVEIVTGSQGSGGMVNRSTAPPTP
jgi:hypothetical protein